MWLNAPVPKPKPLEQIAKSGQTKDTVKANWQKPPEPKEKQEVNPYGNSSLIVRKARKK